MNWCRGLIRLCLVGSVFWAVPVGWLTWTDDNLSWIVYEYYRHDDAIWAEINERRDVVERDRKNALERALDDFAEAHSGRVILKEDAPPPLTPIDGYYKRMWTDDEYCFRFFRGPSTNEECKKLLRVENANYSSDASPRLQRYLHAIPAFGHPPW